MRSPTERSRLRLVAIVATFVAVALGIPSTATGATGASRSWITFGGDVSRTGSNDLETTLTPDTVGDLTLAWTFRMRGVTIAQPVLAAGVDIAGVPTDVVYIGSARGWLSAVRASDGSLVWRRDLGAQHTGCPDLPHGTFGVSGSPFLDLANGRLFAVGGDGELHALDLATGAELPGWPVVITNAPERNHVYGAVNLVDGRLYVATASFCDFTPYHGRVDAFDATTGALVGSWFPIGKRGASGGGIWGPGGVAVDPGTGDVFAATGNALTSPESYRHAEEVVRLDPDLHVAAHDDPRTPYVFDNDFGATPLLFQAAGCPPQLVVKQKSGQLFLYDLDGIGGGYRQIRQVANSRGWQFNGIPAFSATTDMVYVTNNSDSDVGPFVHGIVAFRVGPQCRLSLAWQRRAGLGGVSVSPPTVAGGIVYFGDGPGNTVHAFDAATGAQPWTSGDTIRGPIFAAPTIANGMLFVGSWDGTLYAFGLPA